MRTGSWLLAAGALLSGALLRGAFCSDMPESIQSRDFLAEAASTPISLASVQALPPDFAQVSATLYRSGQPTQQGVSQLAAKGINSILKLNTDDPAEASWASAAGIELISQPMSNDASPTFAQVDAALAVINDPGRQPILVHCHLGHDRTGAVVAAYRVTVQNWSVQQAVEEAKSLGYDNPKFQDLSTWLNGYVAHHATTMTGAAEEKSFSAQGIADRVQPDWSATPGKLCTPQDDNFLEYRYAEHIPYCQRNVTEQMKQQIAAHYGIPKSEWSNYEFDHLIPLGIGGDSHVDNLWPQPHGDPDGSNGKDKLEDQLYQQMKAGTMTQAEAVRQIYAWFGTQPRLRKYAPAAVSVGK